jgi:hypothetical protein
LRAKQFDKVIEAGVSLNVKCQLHTIKVKNWKVGEEKLSFLTRERRDSVNVLAPEEVPV